MASTQGATPPAGALLLTGAAGQLGRVLQEPLSRCCGPEQPYSTLRLSDRVPVHSTVAGVQAVCADLSDAQAVEGLLQGVQAVVHLGGVAVEGPFAPILQANILGIHHLYEACRRQGCRRVVLASSNHVTGGYPRTVTIGPSDPPRPDGYYGASKLFAEGMASMAFDRYGIETVCLRLGSVTAQPEDARALSTWLSHRDFIHLVQAALQAPAVGCLTVYGVSANRGRWWRDEGWQRLGYTPQDSADAWAAELQNRRFEAGSPMERLQGGSFLGIGP